ncbi:hypothetical protein [uncultured Anaerofustis sp.]|uniref:hypothetical protein n=1 Tax=uncultured Anaerofustis sp. TaxID=904996 RepID=UPI0025D8121D|nr:hypothetical protein [uncultured Anaerofustis sp.]
MDDKLVEGLTIILANMNNISDFIKAGEKETFTCPLCGGTITARRYRIDGFVHAKCENKCIDT